jgi:hypothetical protein
MAQFIWRKGSGAAFHPATVAVAAQACRGRKRVFSSVGRELMSDDVEPAAKGGDQAIEAMQVCPNCSMELCDKSCKLVCPLCGFFLSCSDFY